LFSINLTPNKPNGIFGAHLPTSIASLSDKLEMGGNRLSGIVPDVVWKLKKLEGLTLNFSLFLFCYIMSWFGLCFDKVMVAPL